jgi:hypothetical protein
MEIISVVFGFCLALTIVSVFSFLSLRAVTEHFGRLAAILKARDLPEAQAFLTSKEEQEDIDQSKLEAIRAVNEEERIRSLQDKAYSSSL